MIKNVYQNNGSENVRVYAAADRNLAKPNDKNLLSAREALGR